MITRSENGLELNRELKALRENLEDAEAALARTELALERARDERARQAALLQDLSRRLLEVQERERRRLAQDLHDELGQLLTRLRFALAGETPAGPEPARLELARTLLDEAVTRVRRLSFDLRPALLDHLGLAPALRWLFERFTTSTGIQVDFEQSGLESRFAPVIETAAYRIIQEAMTNAARHAGVATLVVRAWTDEQALNLQIEDEGVGFEAQVALNSTETLGLPGIAERVDLLAGTLDLNSTPGEGTRILVSLPTTEDFERNIDEHFRRLGR